MPRTLPAALTTVMDAGTYEPYLRVIVNSVATDTGATTLQPMGFKIEPLKATVTFQKFTDDVDDMLTFRIVRGALISGTPSTISTIWYIVNSIKYNGKFVTLEGEPLSRIYQTGILDGSYQTNIEYVIGSIDTSAVYSYEGTADWKSYQFYPTGKTPVFSPANKLFTILKQKYLVFATENGWDGTNNNYFFFCAAQSRANDYTFVDMLFHGNEHAEARYLISRDESNSVHTTGFNTNPIHNLGFLPSTAVHPTSNPVNSYVGAKSSKIPVHLKYRTGDSAICVGDSSGLNQLNTRINVTEVLDLKSTPAWYQIIEALVWFDNTEGGALPSTIEAAAPYTPLATGNFDNNLSSNDNNIQAALETLDDHTHSTSDAAFKEVIQDIIGDLLATLSNGFHTGASFTYNDVDGVLSIAVSAKAETNTNDIFRCNTAGASTFSGTINGAPSGTSVVYNAGFTGNENALVPASTSQLAKLRLYNTTRGNSALISNCNTGTNTITLTANAPASWANGDTITITSQTVSGGTGNWIDLEITSGPTDKTYLMFNVQVIDTTTTNIGLRIHPFETFATSKQFVALTQVTNVTFAVPTPPIKITSNVFSISWNNTGAASFTVTIREAGLLY